MSMLERLGVAGILVAFCALVGRIMWQFFTAQLALKDERNEKLTDLFITATREQTAAVRDCIASQREMAAAIDKLTKAVDGLQERRAAQRD